MMKSSLGAVLVGFGFLVGCSHDPEPAATNPATVTLPTRPTEEKKAEPTPAPPPPARAPAPAVETPNAPSREQYCTAREAQRLARGSMTGSAPTDDITAMIVASPAYPESDIKASTILMLANDHLPVKGQDGAEATLTTTSETTELVIDSYIAADEAFAVGTYDVGIRFDGEIFTCSATHGMGDGSPVYPDQPTQLVITTRTATLVEGTFDYLGNTTAFSVPIATRAEGATACCF